MVHPAIRNGLIVRISLGMLVAIGGGLVTMVTFCVTLSVTSASQGKAIEELKGERKEYVEIVRKIDSRLSNIEGRLGVESKE